MAGRNEIVELGSIVYCTAITIAVATRHFGIV